MTSASPGERAASDDGASEVTTFGGLSISFDARALRPRAWTVSQSQWAAQLLRTAPVGPVLEVCAGVGQIGLLAVADQPRYLVQIDLNDAACEFARRNADAARMASRVEVRCGRMDEAVDESELFAMIIADPPWVPSAETRAFPADPSVAIDGGSDGLAVARICLDVIGAHLDPHGSALLQLGSEAQVTAVEDHLLEHPELHLCIEDFRSYTGGNVVAHLGRPAPKSPTHRQATKACRASV